MVQNRASARDGLFDGNSELTQLMRNKDWLSTPLGAPENWPHSLRTAVRILLTNRFSMWMGWGPELLFFYNDAYRPTLGGKHPWALGQPASQVWAEIWQELHSRIELAFQRGEATWDEGLMLFLERSGYSEETYHTFSYSPLPDDAGGVGGMLCVVSEDTERVIGERRLTLLRELASGLAVAQSEADVYKALEAAVRGESRDLPFFAVYVFDDHAKSARLASQYGFASGDVTLEAAVALEQDGLLPLGEIVHGNAALVHALPSQHRWPVGPWRRPPKHAMLVPIAQQGVQRPVGVLVAGLNPHRDIDQSYKDFLGLLVGQVSAGLANARAYEAERRRADALMELDRAKTVFFSNISHEFRTPLTLMLGPTEDALAAAELLDDGAQKANRERWEFVHRNALRLLKLVNNLLEFSRIEAGRLRASYQPLDLGKLTQDLVSIFRSAVERAGLTLTVRCEPLNEPAYVDPDMWDKIVLNLLSNAFKFTYSGGITVTQHKVGGNVVLTVEDTGVGVPSAELPRLFERFHRIEGARGRTHEGSGIGLALVQELVQLHSGNISATSREGLGTTFTVSIPLGKAHLPQEHVRETSSDRGASTTALAFAAEAGRWLPPAEEDVGSTPQLLSASRTSDPWLHDDKPAPNEAGTTRRKRPRILLADDNADMREYIERLIADRWEVKPVADGRQALAAAVAHPPDLVLTDVMMPEMDGFALLSALRAHAATRSVPVVMLSARAGEESRIEGLQAGADDYLIKPFSGRELLARIATHLELSRLRIVAERERATLHGLFMNAPAFICILKGSEHIFELANPAYLELIGTTESVIGMAVRQAVPEVEGQGYFEILDKVYRTGESYYGNEAPIVLQRDGKMEQRHVNFVYQATRDFDGNIDGIVVFGFEVTDLVRSRRKVEEEHAAAEEARARAEAAVRVRDDFMSMASHELRTPLTALSLQTDTVLRRLHRAGGDTDKAALEKIGVVRFHIKRLEQLINGLMDVSRISAGRFDLNLERADLAVVTREVFERFVDEAQRAACTMTIDTDADVVGTWDVIRLEQIVTNLITNALKYGQGKPVHVTVRKTDETAVLEVRDAGIGIAQEDQARIFSKFERAASDRHFGGFGLGLWIVRQIVEAMGGQIGVDSRAGAGAAFRVELPRH